MDIVTLALAERPRSQRRVPARRSNRSAGDAPEIPMPPGDDVSGFAMSPDGRSLVFQAAVDGKRQLWLRLLDSETARPLAGTEGATFTFWSPDNQSVAFFAGGKLKRIDVSGGIVQNLADAPFNTRGGAWNAAGTILFTRSATEPLSRPGGWWQGRARPPRSKLRISATVSSVPARGRRFLFFAFGPRRVRGSTPGGWTRKRRRVSSTPNRRRSLLRRTT